MAPASVSMWAASESRASDEASTPTTTSTAMKTRMSTSAAVRRRESPVWTWEWP